jgi:hypothetical protein
VLLLTALVVFHVGAGVRAVAYSTRRRATGIWAVRVADPRRGSQVELTATRPAPEHWLTAPSGGGSPWTNAARRGQCSSYRRSATRPIPRVADEASGAPRRHCEVECSA